MCGRDARVPGWASSTQLTGNMIYITPRNRARRRLQASSFTPGSAGVSPATLFLAGGGGASARRCRQAATLPACTALASPNERQGPVAVPSQRRRWPRLRQAMCGRDARVPGWAIIHTTNREYDLHHAQESGKAPFASLTYHPRERGRLARNLISGWRGVERRRNVAGRQPPCRRERHRPVRMNGKAPLPFHPCGGDGQGCAGPCAGGTPAFPGGPSSTQLTGNLIYITTRNGAKRRLQASRITPGNAGVSPASLFLAGGGGASAQRCRQAATLPACTALAGQNERQAPVAVPSQRRSRPRLRQAMCGRGPRSRVGHHPHNKPGT